MAQSYLFLIHGGDPEAAGLSIEGVETQGARWLAWAEDLKGGGYWQGGQALEPVGRAVTQSGVVSDGPFAESKELIAGYVLVEAANLDEAARLAEKCPVRDVGGWVEVRPVTADGLCPTLTAHLQTTSPE